MMSENSKLNSEFESGGSSRITSMLRSVDGGSVRQGLRRSVTSSSSPFDRQKRQ